MANGFSISIIATDNASATFARVNKNLAAIRAPAERFGKELNKFTDLSGLKSVARGFEQIGSSALSAANTLGRIVAPLGAITGAASAAGLARLVTDWADFGVKLGIAANQVGLTANQLYMMEGAATRAGVSSDALASGVQALGQNMYDAIGGRNTNALGLFKQLGITFDDGTHHISSVSKAMDQLADKIANTTSPMAQLRIATTAFGSAGAAMLPFLRLGSKGMHEYEQRARSYGVFTQANVKDAKLFQMAQADVTLAVRGFTNTISATLTPVLTPMLEQLADWISSLTHNSTLMDELSQGVQSFGQWVQGIQWQPVIDGARQFGADMLKLGGFVKWLIESTTGWKTAIEGVFALWIGSKFLGVLNNVNTLRKAITGASGTPGALVAGATAVVGALGLDAATESNADKEATTGHRGKATLPGRGTYSEPDTTPNNGVFDWIDRQLQGLGIEGMPAPPPVPSNDRRSEAMTYLQGQGWTKEQAAGMVSNMLAESKLNSGAVGDSGQAYGLGQWHPDRQANFAKQFGHSIRDSTFEEQLKFYNDELTTGSEQSAGRRLRGAKSAYDAGSIVSQYDERPADRYGAARSRGNAAEQLASLDGPQSNDGQVGVHVRITTAPGLQATTTTRASGKALKGPPRIDTAMVLA